MPLSKVDISDDLIVNFDKSPENTKFRITLTNKGKRSIRLKRIGSYSEYIHVVNFDENDAIIVSGGQKEYLFEAEYSPQIVSSQDKIRFSFNNRTHVTRTIQIIHTPKNSIQRETSQKPLVESWVNSSDKIVFKEHDMKMKTKPNRDNDRERDRKSEPYKPGTFRVKVPRDEDWLKDFRHHCASSRLVDITENLSVEFDGFEKSRMLGVSIRNQSKNKLVTLSLIEIGLNGNQSSVKLSKKSGNVAESKLIPAQAVRKLEFEVAFKSGVASTKQLLKFHFDHNLVIRRSIQINYRIDVPRLQRSDYDVPDELVNLISRHRSISFSTLMNGLDAFVPTVNDDYQAHFHNLLYLEGKRKKGK